MSKNAQIVQFALINDMLGDDPGYVREFCEAAITSFSKFEDEYVKYMHTRDLHNLRKAGHRIKPVAQMIGVNQLVAEYQDAKQMLQHHSTDSVIDNSIRRVSDICDKVIGDFNQRINQL